MIPLQRISTKATIPTIIVTSPGFQVSLWPRAMIQVRMNGARHAATSSQSSVEKTVHASAELFGPTAQLVAGSPAQASFEFGLPLVVNQGIHSDASRTSAAPIPASSPGDTLDRSRKPLLSSALASIAPTLQAGIGCPQPRTKELRMAVTKIIEVVGSSPVSSDAAVKAALAEASHSLRNIKAVDVVSTGLRGENLDEWRALVRISFLVERVSE